MPSLWRRMIFLIRSKFYMMCLAAVGWGIWNVRNKVTFEKHKMQSPVEVVFTICTFLLYWAMRLQSRNRDTDTLMNEATTLAPLMNSASAGARTSSVAGA